MATPGAYVPLPLSTARDRRALAPAVAHPAGTLAAVRAGLPRVSEESGRRFDAEVLQFLALCRPTDRERAAAAEAHRDAGRCCVGVPGVAGGPRAHGSWTTLAALPGAELDLVLPVDAASEHVPVTLSLVAARLGWDGRFARVTTDACARVPWLWCVHVPTDLPVALRLVRLDRLPPRQDPHVLAVVGARPAGVRAAALFLKAALASKNLSDGPSGFALTLLAGHVLASLSDADLERHPGLGPLALWTWVAGLPETGTLVVGRHATVRFGDPDQPLRVVVPDPADPLTDCAQCGAHFWGALRRLCRVALLQLGERVSPVGPPASALLPGTFLHPAQWLLWQLKGRVVPP